METASGGDVSGKDKQWITRLGILASVAGLLAFMGIANYHDLLRWLSPDPAVPGATSPSASPNSTPDLETVRWTYIQRSDTACAPAVEKARQIPAVSHVTYEWVSHIFDLRHEMMTAWESVQWPVSPLDQTNAGKLRKIWSDFVQASNAWAAMAENLRNNDYASYNRNLGFYTTARDSFVDGANSYGFSTCGYAWASVSPFTPGP